MTGPRRFTPKLARQLTAAALAALLGGAAHAQALVELYEAARAYDATYLAARAQADAAEYRAAQADALALPTLAANLRRAGLGNVTVRCFDGCGGARGEAPFDAIVLSGSVALVPQPLLEQLKRGGRLIAIVGDEPVMRARLYKRIDDASWSQLDLFDTVAPRLRNFPQPDRFSF